MLENSFPRARCARKFVFLIGLSAVAACGPAPAPQGVNDPFEPANRGAHKLNIAADTGFFRPVSKLMGDGDGIVLRRVKTFSKNLGTPGDVVNNVLQFRIVDAAQNTLRFAVNSTFGLGGLFDPAGTLGVVAKPTDFGETLHIWGVGEGPYVELPLLGPSTGRDVIGSAVDLALDPMSYVLPEPEVYFGAAAKLASQLGDRARYSGTVDSILYDSADSYAQTRLLYLQNRRFELGQTADQTSDFVDPYEDPYGQ